MKWPRIRSRRTTAVSPWVSIIAREVEFARGAPPQTYHAVEQADYISIVALTHGDTAVVRRERMRGHFMSYQPLALTHSPSLPGSTRQSILFG